MGLFYTVGVGGFIVIAFFALLFSFFIMVIRSEKERKVWKERIIFLGVVVVLFLTFSYIANEIGVSKRKGFTKESLAFGKQVTSLVDVSDKYYRKYHQYGTLDSLYVFDPRLQDVLTTSSDSESSKKFNYRPTIVPSGALLNSNIVGVEGVYTLGVYISMIWKDGKVIKLRCHSKNKMVNDENICKPITAMIIKASK